MKASERMRAKRRSLNVLLASLLGGISAGVLGTRITSGIMMPIDLLLILLSLVGIGVSLLFASINIVVPEEIKRIIPIYIPYSRTQGPIPLGDYGLRVENMLRAISTQTEAFKKLESASDYIFVLVVSYFLQWMASFLPLAWGETVHSELGGWRVTSPRPTPDPRTKFEKLRAELSRIDKRFKQYSVSVFFPESNEGFPLPPKSDFKITSDGAWLKITIKNKYCNLIIGFSQSASGLGLGQLSQFVSLKDITKEGADNYLMKNYGYVVLYLDFKATFSKWRSLLPRSDQYYDWAERLLQDIRGHFDFEPIWNYHKTVAGKIKLV